MQNETAQGRKLLESLEEQSRLETARLGLEAKNLQQEITSSALYAKFQQQEDTNQEMRKRMLVNDAEAQRRESKHQQTTSHLKQQIEELKQSLASGTRVAAPAPKRQAPSLPWDAMARRTNKQGETLAAGGGGEPPKQQFVIPTVESRYTDRTQPTPHWMIPRGTGRPPSPGVAPFPLTNTMTMEQHQSSGNPVEGHRRAGDANAGYYVPEQFAVPPCIPDAPGGCGYGRGQTPPRPPNPSQQNGQGGPEQGETLAPLPPTGRVKEWDRIELGRMPSVPEFRYWKVTLRDEVSGATGYPDHGFRWIREVEAPGATLAALGCSGSFPGIDSKLAAALSRSIDGEFARNINIQKRTMQTETCC